MSRFHFDEAVMSEVAAALSSASGETSVNHTLLLSKLPQVFFQSGFGIENSLSNIQDVMKSDSKLLEKMSAGAETVVYICQRVNYYSDFISDDKRIDATVYINQNSINKNFISPFNYYSASDIIDKYYGADFVGSQIWDAIINTAFDGGYEKKVIYDTIRSTIDGLNPRNEIPNSISNLFDKYKLGQIKSETEILTELKNIKGFSNVSKYMEEAKFDLNVVKIIASDYSVNLEYLASIERSLKETGMDTKILNQIMNSMRNDYENKYIYAAKELLKKGVTTFVDTALETTTVGQAILGVKKWSKIAFDRKDGGKANDSKKTFASITSYYNNISQSVDKMGDKIASGDYTAQDLDDFSNMFEISKSLRIKQFQAALDFVEGSDIEYCNEAIAYYSKLSMNI
mgnify:CR=1 FL=1